MSKTADRLGVSAKSRAPDDAEYEALTTALTAAGKGLSDLSSRATLFNASAQKTLSDGEKLAVQAAQLFGPLGVGKNGDFSRVKSAKAEHETRYARLTELVKTLTGEIKKLQSDVDERHRLGAAMARFREKEGEEEQEDVAAQRLAASNAYVAAHTRSMLELQAWRTNLPVSFAPLYDVLLEMEMAFATPPPPVSSSVSIASSVSSSVSSSVAAVQASAASWFAPVANIKLW